MAFDKKDITVLYRKRAKNYNLSANLYYLIDIREYAYRKRAADALALNSGDVVVEVGCGTGLNFGPLRNKVGPEGKIVGLDLTFDMLSVAKQRIEDKGWKNISLIQCDAASYDFSLHLDGIISTFAITLMPEYDQIIKKGSAALSPGKKLVVLDFKMPAKWPIWLIKLFVILTRPFGVTLDLADRHPWESIGRYLDSLKVETFYCDAIYIAAGEKGRTVR
ncbi:MAG: methyltransferase domain-containing protein [Desulfobacterales bacterium]|nr:MAG: methyltransferase domain-containing protein [Desulfobacterales bacterium]